MRIKRHAGNADTFRAEIESACAPGVEGRVCGDHCTVACARCGSSGCQCRCSPHCTDAPRGLSSDPAFPIETLIAPLVFEMKRLGLFEPCWSCEGHARPDGAMHKSPSVWFYAKAMVHVRLLADGLVKLHGAGRLHTPWRVTVTFSDPNNPDTTFALEPALSAEAPVKLAQLQSDIAEIARALPDLMRTQARALRDEVSTL